MSLPAHISQTRENRASRVFSLTKEGSGLPLTSTIMLPVGIIMSLKEKKVFETMITRFQKYVQGLTTLPIIPHATRPPALPVVLLSGERPRPRSSTFSCTTIVRPSMLKGPDNPRPRCKGHQ
ncbi:hypothetical protein Tcan_00259 [Toxocara canis]|uniref:Uncharacterized protein n=1 Tax=Toxocara canis TaxID=6265 RepID=A0A0B2UVN3_TOXCA|nr:hypothetical protein Tcan_00259 [Toxocara canis]